MTKQRKLRILCFAFLWLLGIGLADASAFQLGPRSASERIERLESPDRTANLKIDEILARLKLKPGDVVADIGAGTGTFSWPLARAVAPTGKLLAVEISQDLLDHINKRVKEEKVNNIQTVLGEFDDPKLPTRQVDMAFFHNVVHHIEHRAVYLKALAAYLKPTGRIVIIDADQEQPNAGHKDEPELQFSKAQLKQWMEDAGFVPVEQFPDLLDGKFFFIFARR
ncbi:MAG: hypothetical protein A3H27_18210 [Acidobacteria bacterium RIFCSPLOWO2_02_FULL_59_13]|nr:MAG: hypothetical protein A3H27_18210 [Acidobacteria bacterium RIFCSPLOWO2_02_FULL_59_13]